MVEREFAYKDYATHEGPGRDRDDAIRRAFEFMDAHAKFRKKPASERYVVKRVRRLHSGWWLIMYGPRPRGAGA